MEIQDIINAMKEWKEKYEKDWGPWGEFIRINPEEFKCLISK